MTKMNYFLVHELGLKLHLFVKFSESFAFILWW